MARLADTGYSQPMTIHRLVSLALLLLAAPALAQGTKKPEAAFWEWFSKHEARLADTAKTNPMAPMQEVSEQLERVVQEGLSAGFALESAPGKKNTVVISADGEKKLFDAVRAVAAAAPPLKRWTVVAFRQRRSPDESVDISGKAFSVADFSFRETGRKHGKVDVEISIRGMKTVGDQSFHVATYVLLDTLVGELDMETKVGGIVVLPLPAKTTLKLRPLREFPAVVDSL